MKAALHKFKNRTILVCISLLIPLMGTVGVMSTYGMVQNYVEDTYENPFEQGTSIKELFKSNYVLYRNLYEKVTGENTRYVDIYMKDIRALVGDAEYSEDEIQSLKKVCDGILKSELEAQHFSEVMQSFDYYMEDNKTGAYVSNMVTPIKENLDNYVYLLEIAYDENGSASILTAKSENTELLMKNAAEYTLTKNRLLQEIITENGTFYNYGFDTPDFLEYGDGPKNCRVIYGVTQENWQKYGTEGLGYYPYSMNAYYTYRNSGVMSFIWTAFWLTGLLALFLPLTKFTDKPFHEIKYCHLPLELILVLFIFSGSFTSELLNGIIRLLEGEAVNDFISLTKVSEPAAVLLSWLTHALVLWLTFFAAWYLGLNVRPLREKGFKRYIKEHSLIYRIFPFCKKQLTRLWHSLEHIDVTKNAGKTILKIVLVNAAILFFISCLWFGGIMVTIVYSVVLYFTLKLYVSRMQKKYSVLLNKIQEISSGNLNVEITEDLGIFNPFKEQLLNIQTGFRHAVEEEVKSQKMKSELITNVSHDLKTPLTAIITYVDLLKDENITKEQQKEYLDTLERKSLRLKVLIEDLFEVSKATSGNVTMHYMDVDICNLVKQVELEMSDKLEAAGLEVRMDMPAQKVIVSLDSQRTYRIYENLIQNIAKYAMPGTRVYIQGTLTDNRIVISLKNISATEITVAASELTERFVRGDTSRNTEGSGLGLAIVKSFVELQGGRFVLENDGDLFKAITSFPCKS